LASYPANLEMARFRFVGRRLADEEVVRLSDAVLFKW
jgi:hypothetical protein